MNKLIEKIKNRISEISEPIRPVGWSKKIEVVETKAVLDIIHEEAEAYNEVKTNADYIRNMTDEELAELFTKLAWNSEVQTTPLKYLDWLQSEADTKGG